MSQLNSALSEKQTKWIVLIILGLYPLVGMGIDLIAPSLPAISHNLNASSHFAKNLITIYLLGYALGNFIVGFLSDALGRRKLMLLGLFIFVIASLLPVFFPNPFILLFARFCQGFTIAAFAVTGRGVFADVLPQNKLLHIATFIATMWGIGPIIGPVIGGYLQFYFNWQACFYFFAGFGFVGFITLFFVVPETHQHRQPLQLQQLKNNFFTIVTHRLFIGIVTLMGIAYSLLIVFNTLGPFLIQVSLGYSSIYFGHIALVMGFIFLCGTFLCRRLLKILSPEDILYYAICFLTVIIVINITLAFIYEKNIWLISIPSFFMFLGCGVIYPTAMGKGLVLFRHLVGSGAAIMNLINLLITSITAFIMSFINVQSAIPMAFIYLVLILLAGTVYYFMVRPKNLS